MGSDNNKSSVRINIYGKQYNIAGDASRGDILRYAKYVDEKLESLLGGRTQSLSVDKMILAALNITEDLHKINMDRDEALEVIDEKEKKIEGYTKLWDEAKSGFYNAKQEYEGAREDILSSETECQRAREEAEKLREENTILKKKIEEMKLEIQDLQDMHIQMQLFIPEIDATGGNDSQPAKKFEIGTSDVQSGQLEMHEIAVSGPDSESGIHTAEEPKPQSTPVHKAGYNNRRRKKSRHKKRK